MQPVATFDGPDAVKRATMAGLGMAMVSQLTVEDELASGRLAVVPVKAALPMREILLIDHPQKHHGAACRAMLQMFAEVFPKKSTHAGGATSGKPRLG